MANEEPIRVTTLNEFLKWASQFDTGENSVKYLYRGVSNAEYKIDASAYRRLKKTRDGDTKQDGDFERFLRINRELIGEARFRGHDQKNGQQLEDLEILAEFQHYGAATCLMDFTYNILVALWFACKQKSDNSPKKCCLCKQETKTPPIDGKVVAVNPDGSSFMDGTPTVSTIDIESLPKKIYELFRDSGGDIREKLYQWQPRHQNNRIIAQQSIFVFGVLEINPHRECIIDGNSKRKIRESLRQICGITEDMLFPDFDGYARQHSQEVPYRQPSAAQYRELAADARQRGEYETSKDYYNAAIDLDPNNGFTYFDRASVSILLLDQRSAAPFDYEQVIKDYEDGISRTSHPTFLAIAYLHWGVLLKQLRRYSEAIDKLQEGLQLAVERDRPSIIFDIEAVLCEVEQLLAESSSGSN